MGIYSDPSMDWWMQDEEEYDDQFYDDVERHMKHCTKAERDEYCKICSEY